MRMPLAVLFCLVLFSPQSWCGEDPVPPGMESLPQIVARVNEKPIFRQDLIRELCASFATDGVDDLVRRLIVERTAQDQGLTVTNDEIEIQTKYDAAEMATTVKGGIQDAGEKSLEVMVRTSYGLTIEQYKQQVVRESLLLKKILGRDLRPTPAELQKFLNDNPALFQPLTRYKAAHILISPFGDRDFMSGGRLASAAAQKERLSRDRKLKAELRRRAGVNMGDAPEVDLGPEWEAAHQRAIKVLGEITAGRINWDEAVEKYSQDPSEKHKTIKGIKQPSPRESGGAQITPGETGWFTSAGPMVDEFYEGVKNLKPKDPPILVRTQFGYHIVKILKIEEPQQKTFEELRNVVERKYIDSIIQQRSEAWLLYMVKQVDMDFPRTMLWPPISSVAESDPDPVLFKVKNMPVKRSMVWAELLRSRGPEALTRLINREIALGPLKTLGPLRLAWEKLPKEMKDMNPMPPAVPIEIKKEELDNAMLTDFFALDDLNKLRKEKDPKSADVSLEKFIFERYGQSMADYHRALEAGIVLSRSVRSLIRMDEATLRIEFAIVRDFYREGARYQVRQILLSLPPNADQSKRNEVHDLAIQRADAIEKDKNLWNETLQLSADDESKSKNGSLGILSEDSRQWGDLYREIEAKNPEPGHVQVFDTNLGSHIVFVEKRLGERIPTFEEVRPRLEQDYIQARADMFLDIWTRSVEAQAKIERFVFGSPTAVVEDYFPMPEAKKHGEKQ